LLLQRALPAAPTGPGRACPGAAMAPCRHFARGFCRLGAACSFSHTEGGLVQRTKTAICRHFQRGYCARAETCCFAHGEEELGEVVYLSPEQLNQPLPDKEFGESSECAQGEGRREVPPHVQLHNYKTVICRHWASRGTCFQGANCGFAHGEDELLEPGQMAAEMRHMQEMQHLLEAQEGEAGPEQKVEEPIEKLMGELFAEPKPAFAFPADEVAAASGVVPQLGEPPASVTGLERKKYKTDMCWNFEQGKCRLGDQCTWAHHPLELRRPGGGAAEAPPGWEAWQARGWQRGPAEVHPPSPCQRETFEHRPAKRDASHLDGWELPLKRQWQQPAELGPLQGMAALGFEDPQLFSGHRLGDAECQQRLRVRHPLGVELVQQQRQEPEQPQERRLTEEELERVSLMEAMGATVLKPGMFEADRVNSTQGGSGDSLWPSMTWPQGGSADSLWPSMPVSMGGSAACTGSAGGSDLNTYRYKTELCRHFSRGYCNLGPSCAFAHGESDLRQ